MTSAIKEVQNSIEKEIPRTNCRSFPNKIKRLMQKRRKLKRKISNHERVKYVEVSKRIRKEINIWQQEKKVQEITSAIEKATTLKRRTGRQKEMFALKDKEGREIKDKKDIANRVEEYYHELYNGNLDYNNEDEIIWNDDVEDILKEEVRRAITIRLTKEGKAGGKDGIIIEQIKAGGEVIIEELTQIFNECLKKQDIIETWRISKLILFYYLKKETGKK